MQKTTVAGGTDGSSVRSSRGGGPEGGGGRAKKVGTAFFKDCEQAGKNL